MKKIIFLLLVLSITSFKLFAGADLVVNNITTNPANPKLGDQVQIYFTIKNQGNQPSQNAKLFVSIAPNWITSYIYHGAISVPAIAAGRTLVKSVFVNLTKEPTIPKFTNRHLRTFAHVNAGDVIPETDYDNNKKLVLIPVTFPHKAELYIKKFAFNARTSYIQKYKRLYITIINKGTKTAGAFIVKTKCKHQKTVRKKTITSLAPNTPISFSYRLKWAWQGKKKCTLTVDLLNSVDELIESNNVKNAYIKIWY